jgi:purine-cytosine permease-like protein
MVARKLLRRIHLVATFWLISCVIYLLAAALRQAGLEWWQIFPLSGPSALLIVLLVSLYLYAFFRGADGARYIRIEHPLTSCNCYLGFYVSTPFLGGLAALLASTGPSDAAGILCSIAMGTFATTLFVWIVIDPAAGAIEMLLPASRRHRAERLAERRRLASWTAVQDIELQTSEMSSGPAPHPSTA